MRLPTLIWPKPTPIWAVCGRRASRPRWRYSLIRTTWTPAATTPTCWNSTAGNQFDQKGKDDNNRSIIVDDLINQWQEPDDCPGKGLNNPADIGRGAYAEHILQFDVIFGHQLIVQRPHKNSKAVGKR